MACLNTPTRKLCIQQVRVKSARFSKFTKDHLAHYLYNHPVPCIKRGSSFYAIDHHHLASSLLHSTQPEKTVVVTVVGELDSQGDEFWGQMVERGWVW